MLTEDQSIQRRLADPMVKTLAKTLIETLRRLSAADLEELTDLLQCLRNTDDQEEYESVMRAIEEILEQEPLTVSSFPLTEQTISPGLKSWTEHVGRKIRELRTKAKMKQADLAEAAGLTQTDVRRLEKAEKVVTHLTLAKIARALSVDVGDIDPCAEWASDSPEQSSHAKRSE
jgi:DNA-binding XRE family transcriptional regulator